MQTFLLTAALVLAAAGPALSQTWPDCRHEAQKSATIDADGARMLLVRAGAGSLKVQGVAGLERVVVRGRACASTAGLLAQIELTGERRGATAVVEAMQRPDGWNISNGYAFLDVVIEVPARMAAEIHDGSGSMDLSNLGALELVDGSGEITADDIHGEVSIRDGSGGITLTRVGGAVQVRDGSGSIELRDVGGEIDITDGSGGIEVFGARSGVRISDGSGGINVDDVAGDFIVARAGSGSIDYANVRGRVDIPRRR